jgi:hypothetical protein
LQVTWIPVAAWCLAAVVALVVLGFCAYELAWKARRLRTDLSRLAEVSEQLGDLRAQLDSARRRVRDAGLR